MPLQQSLPQALYSSEPLKIAENVTKSTLVRLLSSDFYEQLDHGERVPGYQTPHQTSQPVEHIIVRTGVANDSVTLKILLRRCLRHRPSTGFHIVIGNLLLFVRFI